MMRGFLWTEKRDAPAATAAAAERAGAILVTCAVGVVAGLVAANVRLHLGLPGHRIVLWLAPLAAARLLARSSVGATAGAMAAGLAMTLAGGEWAGAAAQLPLVTLAGAIVDAAVGLVERYGLGPAWRVVLVSLAGMAANLVMLARRLTGPLYQSHQVLGVSGPAASVLSYAVFGLVAGLAAAVLSLLLLRAWRVLRARGRRA